jgi:hypothetical protein
VLRVVIVLLLLRSAHLSQGLTASAAAEVVAATIAGHAAFAPERIEHWVDVWRIVPVGIVSDFTAARGACLA